jgi:hypothetical protein
MLSTYYIKPKNRSHFTNPFQYIVMQKFLWSCINFELEYWITVALISSNYSPPADISQLS